MIAALPSLPGAEGALMRPVLRDPRRLAERER